MAAVGINAGSITAYLDLDISKFTSGFANAGKELQNFAQKGTSVSQKFQSVGNAMVGVGSSLTAGVTTPIAAIGAKAVKVSMDFEKAMSNVAAVTGATSKETGSDYDLMSKKAEELGRTTVFTSTEVADAMSYMGLAGWDTQQILSGIPSVLSLAQAGNLDLATTSDIVTDSLSAFGLRAEDTGMYVDLLAQASRKSNTDVYMMGESFKYAAPVMGMMGYSANDAAIAIGLMANQGIKASQAGTSLRSGFLRLADPTDALIEDMLALGVATQEMGVDQEKLEKAQRKVESATLNVEKAQVSYNQAVAKYGEGSPQAQKAMISVEQQTLKLQDAQQNLEKVQSTLIGTGEIHNLVLNDEEGNARSLREILIYLRDTFGELDEQQQAQALSMLFGTEAASGFAAIINASQQDFDNFVAAMDDSTGAADEMADTMTNNLWGAIQLMNSAMDGAYKTIGDRLAPWIKKLANLISELADWFSNLSDEEINTIIKLAGFAAAIGPVLSIGGNLVSTIGTITKGFELLGGGLLSGIKFIPDVVGGFATIVKGFGEAQGVVGKLSLVFKTFWGVIQAHPFMIIITVVALLVTKFVELWNTSEQFREGVTHAIETVKAVFEDFAERFMAIFEMDLPDAIAAFIELLLELPFRLGEIGLLLIGGLIEGITGFDIVTPIKNFCEGVIGFFKDIFGIHSPSTVMIGIGTNMSEGLEVGLSDMPERTEGIFGKVKETIGGWGESIVGFAKDTGTKFVGWVADKFGVAEEDLDKFCSATTNVFNGWGKSTTKIAESTSKSVQRSTNDMSNKSTSNIVKMKNDASRAINDLANNTDKSMTRAKVKAVESATGIKRQAGESITNFTKRARNEINSWSTATANAGSRGSSSFKNNVTKNFSGTANSVKGSLDKTVNEVDQFGNRVEREGDQAGAGFRSNFTGEMQQVPNDFSGEMNEIPDYLIKLANVMPGHGRAIMVNLYNAMRSIVGNIKSLISGIGNSIVNMVNGAIRAFSNLITSANNASNASRRVNGSHANGLSYVPFDGYIAELHQGERVLTKEENKVYNRGSGQSGDVFNFYNTKPEPYEYARQMKKAKRELLENI